MPSSPANLGHSCIIALNAKERPLTPRSLLLPHDTIRRNLKRSLALKRFMVSGMSIYTRYSVVKRKHNHILYKKQRLLKLLMHLFDAIFLFGYAARGALKTGHLQNTILSDRSRQWFCECGENWRERRSGGCSHPRRRGNYSFRLRKRPRALSEYLMWFLSQSTRSWVASSMSSGFTPSFLKRSLSLPKDFTNMSCWARCCTLLV